MRTFQILRTRLAASDPKRGLLPLIVSLVLAGIGTGLLLASHAATPYASMSAESGTPAIGAVQQSCTGASTSDGNCTVFSGTSGSGTSQTSNCFPTPGACGYPDPNYSWPASANAWAPNSGGGVGPANASGTQAVACSTLTASGTVNADTAGQTIQNLNITGQLNINADNVTVKNVCVTYDGGGGGIATEVGGAGDKIENTTIRGADGAGHSIEQAVASGGSNLTLDHVYAYNCGECLHDSPFVVNDSYIDVNANIPGEHYEDVFLNADNTGGSLVANHDTMINTWDQTAIIFGSVQNGGNYNQEPCHNHITLTNSLISGSGYSIYECSGVSQVGTATMHISDNRFARCLTTPLKETGGGNWHCSGSGTNGADSHGLYPYSGSYGSDSYTFCGVGGQTWSGNVYDDDNSPVDC